MKNTKIPHFIVFFDTSTLILNQKFPIHPDVPAFITNYSKNNDVVLEYKVPYVAQEEFKKNYFWAVRDLKSSYMRKRSRLEELVGFKTEEFTMSDDDIKVHAENVLRKNNISVVKTPTDKINFDELIEKAVYYKPPFQEKREKGFKDSVIAETVLYELKNTPKDITVVFVCNDGILREYMKGYSTDNSQLQVFDSMESFKSDLNLRLLKISQERIAELTKEARLAFNEDTNPDALFWNRKIGLREMLYKKYQTYFDDPRLDTSYDLIGMGAKVTNVADVWNPVTNGSYQLSDPVFIGERSRNTLVWQSHIVYIRTYMRKTPFLASEEYKKYSIEFIVEWEAKTDDEGRIITTKILSDEFVGTDTESSMRLASGVAVNIDDLQSIYTAPASGASLTASGIGTVPVTDLGISHKTDKH